MNFLVKKDKCNDVRCLRDKNVAAEDIGRYRPDTEGVSSDGRYGKRCLSEWKGHLSPGIERDVRTGSGRHAGQIFSRPRIDANDLAFIDEEGNVDHITALQRGGLERAIDRVALHARIALGDL